MTAGVSLFAAAGLVLAICQHVRTIHCTMTDVEVNIPLKFENFSITRWLLLENQQSKIVNKEDSPYTIDPDTGQVYLKQIEEKGVDRVYGQLNQQDEFGYSTASFKVFFTKKEPCSDIEDICFWKRITYQVKEGTTGIIGWLTSEYYRQLCPSYEVNYTVNPNEDTFILMSNGKGKTESWSLANKRKLSVSKMGHNVPLKLNCVVKTEKQEVYKLQRAVNIKIIDSQIMARENKSNFEQKSLENTVSYPQKIINISRTAAPYARITQPNILGKLLNYKIKQDTDIFNITKDGIIFVGNTFELRQSTEKIEIIIYWKEKNVHRHENISVRVLENPSDKCIFNNWTFCSEIKNEKACLKKHLCALATAGYINEKYEQRCQWYEGTENNIASYSTCTPEKNTCPDGICDSLEEMNNMICPQDCTTMVIFPNNVNPDTKKGIGNGRGICFCGKISCSCKPQQIIRDRKNEKSAVLSKNSNSSNHVIGGTERPEQHKRTESLGNSVCGVPCILGIVCGIIFLVGIITAIAVCWVGKKLKSSSNDKNTDSNGELVLPLTDYLSRNFPMETILINFPPSIPSSMNVTNIMRKYSLPDPKWEFPRQQLTIEQTLGEGEFGRVLKAKAFNLGGKPGYTVVAVKTLKEEARKNDINDLLSEYQLLKGVSHPNVVQLLGVCTSTGGPIYLIIDFAEYGSLRNYLRKFQHILSTKEDDHYECTDDSIIPLKYIFSFAWQICNGMAYLSSIKLVHRDLAARNVLLDSKMICKISDFGLTRDVYEDNAYLKKSRTRVPIKWMAPESLSNHIYTSKSDVWSFGILLWELVTLGRTPYPGIAVQNLYTFLNDGYRMERPPNCPNALYSLMVKCWAKDAAERPTFHELLQSWEELLGTKNDYLDLKNNAILNRIYFASNDNGELSTKEFSETRNESNIGGYETPNPQQRRVTSANYENQQDYTDMRSANTLNIFQT